MAWTAHVQPDGSTSNEPRADAPHISVLHLFSGKSKHVWPDDNEETLATIIKKYGRSYFKDCPAGLNIHVVEVDYLNCGCYDDVTQRFAGFCRNPSRLPCCNLMANGMFNFLLKEAKRGKYQCVIAGIPCNGYSVVRFEEGGARPLRDRGHLLGLPHLSESDRASLAMSNALTVRSLAICLAIWESGGEVVIENPIDYGTFGLWATNPRTGELDEAYNAKRLRPRHAPIWLMPSMRSFLQAVQAVLLHFAECQLGSDFQKYTTLAATPGWILVASALAAFDNVPCRCSKPHARRACGRDANGDYASAEAARYPDGKEAQPSSTAVVGAKRYREVYEIPDDEPEVVADLVGQGVPESRIAEFARHEIAGLPRHGTSNALRLFKAIKLGLVEEALPELFEIIYGGALGELSE